MVYDVSEYPATNNFVVPVAKNLGRVLSPRIFESSYAKKPPIGQIPFQIVRSKFILLLTLQFLFFSLLLAHRKQSGAKPALREEHQKIFSRNL
jgi:type VI protein secretion system component VasF